MLPLWGCLLIVIGNVNCDLKLSTNVLAVEMRRVTSFQVEISNPPGDVSNKTLVLITQYDDLMQVIPSNMEIVFDNKINKQKLNIKLFSLKVGKSGVSVIIASLPPVIICEDKEYIIVKIYKSSVVESLSDTLGWLYFLSWSFSFYPQIFINFKRKSVVGLSFDFIFFNLFGYLMYNSFNLGLHFIPIIKEQYSLRHPRSVNPVNPNDIFFSVHSFLATMVAVSQCIRYESGNQTVSAFAKIIVGTDAIVSMVFVILAGLNVVLWLDVLYVCSYIKLMVTVTKYVPQVYMNYKRKNTQGFSIGSVGFDFAGGLLSTLQMMLDGYNYGDWTILLENPTKFGLGIISTSFDSIFLVQHYILYGATVIKENAIDLQQISADQKDCKKDTEKERY